MRRPTASRRLGMVGAAVGILLAGAAAPQALAESPAELRKAVDRLGAWLDASDSGPGWKSHLRFDEWSELVDQRGDADWEALLWHLKRLSAETPGLEHPEFVRARLALQRWMVRIAAEDEAGLVRATEVAKAAFQGVTAQDVDARRQRVRQAMRGLEEFLADWPHYVQPWKDYLSWDELAREVESPNPNTATLRLIYERMRVAGKGGQYEAFGKLRQAIVDLGYVVAYERSPSRLKTFYERTLDQLSLALRQYQENGGSVKESLEVGRLMGELRHTLQGSDYVTALQTRYWRPNAYAQVSDRLAGAGVNQDISRTQPVSDVIRGTRITGEALFNASIRLAFTPHADGGRAKVMLRGKANSDNVATRKKVHVYSQSVTNFDGEKPLYISPSGLADGPAVARAGTESQITGVSHRLGLVRRIAGKVAEKARPEGEMMASRKVERQIVQQMDEQSAPLLRKANQGLESNVYQHLRNWDAYPRWLGVSTTPRHLNVGALHVVPQQLAAPGPPPPLADFYDLAVRVHESLVINASTSVLGGKTLDRERSVEILTKLEMEIPAELKDSDEPFSITFADTAPLIAEFRGEVLHVAVRGKAFMGTLGANQVATVRREMELSADYRFEINSDGSAVMFRLGPIAARYLSGEPEDVGANAIKVVMTKKVGLLFKPEISIPAFTLPNEWEKAGELQMRTARADNGWLTLGWRQSGVAPTSAAR